jgi:hypothetical protein
LGVTAAIFIGLAGCVGWVTTGLVGGVTVAVGGVNATVPYVCALLTVGATGAAASTAVGTNVRLVRSVVAAKRMNFVFIVFISFL